MKTSCFSVCSNKIYKILSRQAIQFRVVLSDFLNNLLTPHNAFIFLLPERLIILPRFITVLGVHHLLLFKRGGNSCMEGKTDAEYPD